MLLVPSIKINAVYGEIILHASDQALYRKSSWRAV